MADSGMASLDAMIERLKSLGASNVGARVAAKAAPLIDDAIKKTAKAGTSPSGEKWQPKKDGGRPLVNAASHIQTRALGNYVSATLTGPDVFHNRGTSSMPRRQILPDTAKVPPSVEAALREAAGQVFREITEGRS